MPLVIPAAAAAIGYGASSLMAGGTLATMMAGTGGLESAIMAAPIGTEVATAGEMAGLTSGGVMAGLATGARVLSGVSSVVQGIGQYETGKAVQAEDKSQAQQLQVKANADAAAGENAMLVDMRNTQLTEGKVDADVAAGGGSLTDPGVVNMLGNLEKQGRMNAQNTLYNAETRSTSDINEANAKYFEANQASTAGEIGAAASSIRGVSSFFDKYNTGSTGYN